MHWQFRGQAKRHGRAFLWKSSRKVFVTELRWVCSLSVRGYLTSPASAELFRPIEMSFDRWIFSYTLGQKVIWSKCQASPKSFCLVQVNSNQVASSVKSSPKSSQFLHQRCHSLICSMTMS